MTTVRIFKMPTNFENIIHLLAASYVTTFDYLRTEYKNIVTTVMSTIWEK